MSDWRELHGDQNQRMAAKLLEQQSEINKLRAELAAADQRQHCTSDPYYCPTAGSIESACHGGFDVCCEHPDRHEDLINAVAAAEQRGYERAIEVLRDEKRWLDWHKVAWQSGRITPGESTLPMLMADYLESVAAYLAEGEAK